MDRLSEIRARCEAAKAEKEKGNDIDCACLSWAIALNDIPYLLAEIEQTNEACEIACASAREYCDKLVIAEKQIATLKRALELMYAENKSYNPDGMGNPAYYIHQAREQEAHDGQR